MNVFLYGVSEKTEKQINIIYFVWINPKKNYTKIIKGQLNDILNCGILNKAKLHLEICCEYANLINYVKSIFFETLIGVDFEFNIHTENHYEYYGIKKMYDLAIKEPTKYYLYFHSKGMFNYDNINERHKYEKTLTKGTLYQYEKVIDLFKKNNDIVKIGLFPSAHGEKNFIWFNFFWARGTYLNTCEHPKISDNRFYYEIWSGSGNNETGKVYNLHENNYKKYKLNEAGDILNRLNGTFPIRK
jgi:hypothetical protein